MASFVKALLLVGLVLLVVLLIAGVAGYFWWSKHGRLVVAEARKASAEGQGFGEETDDLGCLEEAVARHRKAPGFSETIAHNLFLKGCLRTSEPTDGFCDGVPKRSEIMASARWQIGKCAHAGLGDAHCRQLFAEVQEYCESDLAGPRHEPE